jgi:MazG family protein
MTSSASTKTDNNPIQHLIDIVKRLRDKDHGCPWDIQQTYATIAPFTIEEAYEVLDSIQKNNFPGLKEELGDLLFQVVFLSQIASEDGTFDFDQVVHHVTEKMISRHPHVFSKRRHLSETDQNKNWEDIKETERKVDGNSSGSLSGVALALPALMRAQKLQKRASRQGFDWVKISQVFDKLVEEIDELQVALHSEIADNIKEEIGDLLFTCVNIARHAGVDAEEALREGNNKFISRFCQVEQTVEAKGLKIRDLSSTELEKIWNLVKTKKANEL